MRAPKVVMRGVGGLTVWSLPAASGLEVVWAGPGSGLRLGFPRLPGGMTTSIEHPTASGTFSTRKEAETALRQFIDAVLAEEDMTR